MKIFLSLILIALPLFAQSHECCKRKARAFDAPELVRALLLSALPQSAKTAAATTPDCAHHRAVDKWRKNHPGVPPPPGRSIRLAFGTTDPDPDPSWFWCGCPLEVKLAENGCGFFH